jgi:hypothetical protein
VNRTLMLLFLGGLVFSLAGCHLPPPVCDLDRVGYPEVYSPHQYDVVGSLRPTVEWIYLDPTCVPASYQVQLQKDEYDPYTHRFLGVTVVDETISGRVTAWTPSFDLEPVQKYTYSINVYDATGTSGSAVTFFTGPLCPSKGQLPPRLRMPPNGGVVYQNSDEELIFEWEYSGGCLPNGFQIQIASEPSFVPEAGFFNETDVPLPNRYAIVNSFSGITPCDTYYWRVLPRLGMVTGGEEGSFSPAWSFYLAADECPLLVPADLGTILEPVMCEVTVGAYCRSGPGTQYDVVAVVEPGTKLPVQGRNADASWVYVQLPDNGIQCNMKAGVCKLQGDLERSPTRRPPPPPEPTLTPRGMPLGCSKYNANANICIARGCKWDPIQHPNSPCVSK